MNQISIPTNGTMSSAATQMTSSLDRQTASRRMETIAKTRATK